MSLEGMLSAIRSLILDRMDLPESIEDRARLYQTSFPELSPDEVADLSNVTPSKLRIYTQTIFAGERSTLKTHFPMTFGLLKQRFDAELDTFELVRDLHEKRPWKSYLTAGLAANFARYLDLDRPDIKAKIPEIGDVANLERLTLAIARGKDSPLRPTELLTTEALETITVGDLLEKRAVFAPYVRRSAFAFDAVAFRDEFWENGREVPEHPVLPGELFAIGGRTRALAVEWLRVSLPIFEFAEANKEMEFALGDLAESFVAGEDESVEQSVLFLRFLDLLKTAMAYGIILVKTEG
ncbi:MAG: hypothetical protein U0136_07085 [Bdellovibrionota bacterium]